MKKPEIQIDEMQFNLLSYINKHSSIWAGNLPFTNALQMQTDIRTELDETKDKQNISSKGFTEEKAEIFDNTNQFAFIICSEVKLYANFNDNDELFQKVNYKLSALNNIPYSQVVTKWNGIKKAAASVINTLVNEGYYINPQTLIDFQALIDSFKAIKPRTSGTIKNRKEATTEIGDITKKIQKNLHDFLDNAIVAYINLNLDFYQGYLLRRELTDLPHRKLALRINIIDNASKMPLTKVRMKIEGINKVYKSSEFGNIYIRDLETGTYTLTFEREDFVTHTEIIHYEKGIRIDLKLQMDKKA